MRRFATLAAICGIGLVSLGIGPWSWWRPAMQFHTPKLAQLSLPGDIEFELRIRGRFEAEAIRFYLNADPVVPASLVVTDRGVTGVLADVPEGTYLLRARLGKRRAHAFFWTREFNDPDECEILNDAECLLPFPSSRFLAPDDQTETGVELELPAVGMPELVGPPLDPAPLNGFDGFSPTAQILMHFPGGVDLEASRAPVLLDPDCCGQVNQVPYENVRTVDRRSLERNSPTVLIDAESGKRVLHFVELDARTTDVKRQTLILRPGVALVPGRRYIVAVRKLRDPAGRRVRAEPAFRALRSRLPTTIPAIEARRAEFKRIFGDLARAGVRRRNLILAFEFVVRSQHQLTHELLTMRDDALEWIDTSPLFLGFDTAFNDANFHPDCATTGEPIWRRVRGSFPSPYYLTGPIGEGIPGIFLGAPLLNVDANGTPVRAGFVRFPFDFAIPCSALDPNTTVHPLLLGHGLFGTGAGIIGSLAEAGALSEQVGAGSFDYIMGATDWRGLSGRDIEWVGATVIGGILSPDNRLNNFPSFVARLKQGVVNTLVLAHVMKTGRLNVHPLFQAVPGSPESGVFPGPDQDTYYYGISLGGIMGQLVAGLTADIERFGIDIGAINFSMLLQRSTQFDQFEQLLTDVGLEDPMQTLLGTALLHEMWVTSEPAAVARHVTGTVAAPLRGSPKKKILMQLAWLDKQVSNQASEVAVRTLGIPSLKGSLLRGLQQIPDVPDGASSAAVFYDTGSFDVFDPAFDAVIPALANQIPSPVCDPHSGRPTIPAGIAQLGEFLRPNGTIRNFCTDNGVCDASEAFERPFGEEEVCDPLTGP